MRGASYPVSPHPRVTLSRTVRLLRGSPRHRLRAFFAACNGPHRGLDSKHQGEVFRGPLGGLKQSEADAYIGIHAKSTAVVSIVRLVSARPPHRSSSRTSPRLGKKQSYCPLLQPPPSSPPPRKRKRKKKTAVFRMHETKIGTFFCSLSLATHLHTAAEYVHTQN